MAELTPFQVDWIEKAAGKPITDDTVKAAADKLKKKEDLSQQLIGVDLASCKEQIASAQGFSIEKNTRDSFGKALWKKVLGKPTNREKIMKWHATDEDVQKAQGLLGGSNKSFDTAQDIEVDTANDLIDIKEIPDETLDALADSLERILQIQNQMLEALDDDGNRLYSDDDIMRELWTPLVRDGTIPENMVPDKFSETKRAYDGAAEFYKDKLEAHTKASKGNERLMFWANLTKDTLALGGTMASSIVTIGDAKEIAAIKEKSVQGTATDQEKVKLSELETKQNFVNFGVVAMNGMADLTVTTMDEVSSSKKANWVKVADKSLEVLGKVAASACGPFFREFAIGHEEHAAKTDDAKATAAFANALQACITGSISSARMIPAVIQACNEDDPAKRRAYIAQAIDRFAEAVGQCFVTAANESFKGPAKGEMIMYGSIVTSAIKTIGNADLVFKAIQEGKTLEAAMRLGGACLEGVMMAAAEGLKDALKKDVSNEDYAAASFFERQFMEKTSYEDSSGTKTQEEIDTKTEAAILKAETAQKEAAAKLITAINKNLSSLETKSVEMYENLTPQPVDKKAEAFAKELAKQEEEHTRQKAEKDIEKFFGDKEAVQAMFEEWDEKIVGYEQLYIDATPSTDLEGMPPDEAQKAIAAIDAVMARTAELRARAELINGITSSVGGLVGALVPGGGAVMAVQKMVYDLYLLQRAVAAHNKWCESMELAFRANSAYGPAILNTLSNAKINLSQKSINIILDAAKVGSETARMFDPTGAATISSAVTSMSQALFDYGYKRHKEAAIARGWNAYKFARENPRNRKAARNALRLNSTLAKCCIAYGAVVAGDASAKEAIRRAGVSPGMLADDKDVCKRLICFLEADLSDDPVVLQAEKLPHKWAPGKPEITPQSWFSIKMSAMTDASPKLDKASGKTPAVDQIIAKVSAATCWDGKASYSEWRAGFAKDTVEHWEKRREVAALTIDLMNQLDQQMKAYSPKRADLTAQAHDDMADIAATYSALAKLMIRAATPDTTAARPEELDVEDQDVAEDEDEELEDIDHESEDEREPESV